MLQMVVYFINLKIFIFNFLAIILSFIIIVVFALLYINLNSKDHNVVTIKRKNIGKETYEKLFDVSQTIGFDIQQLIWMSRNNMGTFEKLMETSHQIQEFSQQNAASIQETTATINELASQSVGLNNKIIDIDGKSNNSITLLNNNRTTINSIADYLLEFSSILKIASKNNDDLSNSSKKINGVIDYIKGISNQINLLALNASIEAARAGEAGKGFSVVAGEIRKLSEETDKGISEIDSIFKEILNSISTSEKTMIQCNEKISTINEISSKSSEVIMETENIIKDIRNELNELNKMSNIQKQSALEIEKAIEQVTNAVSETHNITCASINMINNQKSKNDEMDKFYSKLSNVTEDLQGVTVKLKKDNEIIFGVNPFTSPENIKRNYVPILERVCSSFGFKARTIIVKSYDALSEGISDGIIDVGWFSPFAYVHAHEKSGALPIVTPRVGGKTSYRGYIIAKRGSGINKLSDLEGKNFGYVDVKSASGYLYAKHIFKVNGMNPDTMFSNTIFMGNHDKVIESVISGEIDGGATYNEALESAKEKNLAVDDILILAETDDIPKDAIAIRPNMDENIKSMLTSAFINFNDFNNIDTIIQGFENSSDEKYNVIRQLS